MRLALQLRHEGLIDDTETLRRVTPAHVQTLLLPALQPETRLAAPLLAKGLPACPGVVSGKAYTDVDEALDAADRGEQVILVRDHTRPEDVLGMLAAQGIVTEVGGAASHAAVVSRELGRVAVVGCGQGVAATLAGKQITVDGYEGEVREGNLALSAWSENDTPELRELADLARRISPLRAHATGDYPRLDDPSDSAVRAAMDAGHTDVVSATPLIAMLTALRLAGLMSELTVLQAVRLKGRVSPADLAATLDDAGHRQDRRAADRSRTAGRGRHIADQPQRPRAAQRAARRGARGHRHGRHGRRLRRVPLHQHRFQGPGHRLAAQGRPAQHP